MITRSVTLLALADLPQERGMHWRGHGLDLAVFRVGDEAFAIADSCPHQGASLANGRLQGHAVVCPVHGLQFDVRTGCSLVSRNLRSKHYPLQVVDGLVVLDLDETQIKRKEVGGA